MNEKQTIDFESIFNSNNDPQLEPKNSPGFIFTIAWYLITMFIISTLLFSVFRGVDTYTETITPEAVINDAMVENASQYIYILPNTFDVIANNNYYSIDYTSLSEVMLKIYVEKSYPEDVFNDDGTSINLEKLLSNDVLQNATFVLYGSSESDLDILFVNAIQVDFEPYETLTNFASSLLNFIIYILLIIPIFFFLKSNIQFDYQQTRALDKKIFGISISGYLYVVFAGILSNVIITALEFVFSISYQPSQNQLYIESMLQDNGFIFIFLGAVILGPLVEELVFRKAIFGLIKKDGIALVASSVIFASVHILPEIGVLPLAEVMMSLIPYLTIGFIFGYIYIKYNKNVFVVTIVHMLSNFISIMAVLFI